MANFNRWGCTSDDVLTKYKTGSYAPLAVDFGGEAAILAEVDAAVSLINSVLPSNVFGLLTDPKLEEVCARATEGQTVLQLGLKPVVEGLVSIWIGSPEAFSDRPVTRYCKNPGDAVVELPADGFTVNVSTGVVTLAARYAMTAGTMAYASYRTDVANAAWAVPSLRDIAAIGAAGALGAIVYSHEDATWEHVTSLQTRFAAFLEAMGEGKWSPDELRFLRWWNESLAEPTQAAGMSSVRRFRS